MARRFLLSGLLAVAAFTQIHVAEAQSTSPPFPRLGAYLIGGSVQSAFGTTSYQQQVAKLGAAVIGTYPGWSSGGFNMSSAAAAVKAINPNIKLAVYVDMSEFESSSSSSSSPYFPIYTQVSANNWFLRTTSPGGSIIDPANGSMQGINPTTFTNVVAGQNYIQWRARYDAANYFSTNFDGIFIDVFLSIPRVTADFTQSGTSQTPTNSRVNWQTGMVNYVGYLRAGLPSNGQQIWGNNSDWANTSVTAYNQILNGGVMESAIGQSYSYESSGWATLMNYYKLVMNSTIAPGYQIFEQDGSASDYQGMRYGLTSCLLDNAYYFFNTAGAGGGSSVTWFDEFNFNLGPATSAAYSAGTMTAYQNGVYRRDFQNGIALVNPKGNGTQTVTLETSYKHLSGTQAPSVNNGQTVTSVTLNDRDGVILQRLSSQPVPDAPSLTVQ